MTFIVTAVFSVFAAWKWGGWKNWTQYYPTIMYIIITGFVYEVLTCNYPLWMFDSSITRDTFSDFIWAFVIYPCTVLIYLRHYPDGFKMQTAYTLVWISIYALIEFIAYSFGEIKYLNGWNFPYSIAFDLMLFIMLRFHYKRPLIAWPVSFVLVFAVLWYFRLPLNSIR